MLKDKILKDINHTQLKIKQLERLCLNAETYNDMIDWTNMTADECLLTSTHSENLNLELGEEHLRLEWLYNSHAADYLYDQPG